MHERWGCGGGGRDVTPTIGSDGWPFAEPKLLGAGKQENRRLMDHMVAPRVTALRVGARGQESASQG